MKFLTGSHRIYIMRSRSIYPDRRTIYKIGITADSASARRESIRQSGMPVGPILFAARVWSAQNLETELHRRYNRYKSEQTGSGKTEWFALPLVVAVSLIWSLRARMLFQRGMVGMLLLCLFYPLLPIAIVVYAAYAALWPRYSLRRDLGRLVSGLRGIAD